MRVALFFDGKNFYRGFQDRAPGSGIDYTKLSHWLVARVDGTRLWGAYYYTGIESGTDGNSAAQNKLRAFLDSLELLPGFFVHRFARKRRSRPCDSCGVENHYTEEKQVDTAMVADMLRLAAVDAFDIMVLMAGDADHVPAIEGVRALGKQAYVATWGDSGLSPRARQAAFDHIDLLQGLHTFGKADARNSTVATVPAQPPFNKPVEPYGVESQFLPPSASEQLQRLDSHPLPPVGVSDHFGGEAEAIFLDELRLAEEKMPKFVGLNFFVTRWKSDRLDADAYGRRRLLSRLVDDGKVEQYQVPNGDWAIKIRT